MAKNNKVEISLEEKLKQALVPVDEQPYTIPSNWVWTRLGNIYNLFTGNSIPESKKTTKYINLSNGYKYIATKDISYNGEINYENGVIIPYNEEKFKVAKARSSLLCIEGGSAGRKVGIVDRDVCFVNKLCCFESNSNLESKIIYYYIKSENFLSLFRENMNGLIGGVSLGNLKKIEFPLPPLNEQKRIVEKLDFLFEKTKRAKEIIEEVKVDIENRKISILDRAFKGTLTSKWRNENKTSDVKELLKSINDEKIKKWEEDCLQAEKDDNKKPKKPIIKEVKDMIVPVDEQPYKLPDSWVWTRWKEVTEIFSARRVLQEDWKKEGIPFYRAREIIKLSINGYVDNELFISEEHYLKLLKISRIPKTNDLMVSAVGTLGSTYVVKSEDKFYYKDASVLCVSPKKDINSYYLKYLMESFYMKEQIKLNSKGSTVDTLTISKYENFFIPLPPLEEQQEIVRVLDGVLENENKVKELLELEERIEILEKSILHKAFKGELGTQNSSDESALNLLKSLL
ncbi:restriction endonuclease subunit S [Fusobacterium pseudoperiodonticum]|uniref:restriction endonuclease subunit S n=1 Tax=Fusobacterium pseudoperiodonticum TaxID=2663009 RepID=UPI0028D030CE|nr:restriction endonuclease subunit S [Fusobacterium pseudoperiodonticum]